MKELFNRFTWRWVLCLTRNFLTSRYCYNNEQSADCIICRGVRSLPKKVGPESDTKLYHGDALVLGSVVYSFITCRIAPLRRGKTPPNKCPGHYTKQSDGEVPMMLELWGMRSTSSLPLLPGPLWLRMVAPDRALSMG